MTPEPTITGAMRSPPAALSHGPRRLAYSQRSASFRLENIDAPEMGNGARCDAECYLAEVAKEQLVAFLARGAVQIERRGEGSGICEASSPCVGTEKLAMSLLKERELPASAARLSLKPDDACASPGIDEVGRTK